MKFLRRSRIMRISIFLMASLAQKKFHKLKSTFSFRRSRTQALLRAVAITFLLAFYQNCGGKMTTNCNGSTGCSETENSSLSGGKKSSTSTTGTASGTRTGSIISGGTSSGDARSGTSQGWSTGGTSSSSSRGGTVISGGSASSSTGNTSGGSVTGGSIGGTSGGISGGTTGGLNAGGTTGGTIGGTTGGANGGTSGGTTSGATGNVLPLRISTQPVSQDVYEFSRVKLSVIAEGGQPPYNYAWTLNGSAFTGSYVSNAPEINFNVGGYINWKNQGEYQVSITDYAGTVITSTIASIRIKEAEINCASQDYYNLTETRQEILVSTVVPDSPSGDHLVPLKNYFVTSNGAKYLVPVNSNPFYVPGGSAPLFNPINIFLNNNYVQKSGWRMPATSHGNQVTIACTAAVNGGALSNWMRDFNEFPNNPNPMALWQTSESGDNGGCQLWSQPEECARINTSTYTLRGSQIYECRNNKFKYVSGSCNWEYTPPPPDTSGGGGPGGP